MQKLFLKPDLLGDAQNHGDFIAFFAPRFEKAHGPFGGSINGKKYVFFSCQFLEQVGNLIGSTEPHANALASRAFIQHPVEKRNFTGIRVQFAAK
jgi:hypothetical protein